MSVHCHNRLSRQKGVVIGQFVFMPFVVVISNYLLASNLVVEFSHLPNSVFVVFDDDC